MGVAHLVLAQPPLAVLDDQRPTLETVVDLGAPAAHSTQITDRYRHRCQASHVIAIGRRQRLAAYGPVYLSGDPAPTTLSIVSHAVTDYVTYGDNIPGDGELGLIGDVSAGRRVIELGISGNGNAIALARLGAKAISVDPDPDRIGALRLDATDAEVWVECHEGDLGDLGFAPSGTIDVVLSVHTLDVVDDLGRILRQVHRVLKPGAPFVLVLDHPFAAVGTGRRRHAAPLWRRPAHDRRAARRPRPIQLPRRGVPRAGRQRRVGRAHHARHQGPQTGLLKGAAGVARRRALS